MNKIKTCILAFSLLFGVGFSQAQKPTQREKDFLSRIFKNDPAYLFCFAAPVNNALTSTGTSSPQKNGLNFMYSFDGLLWKKLENGHSYFKPNIGKNNGFIDPSIVQGSDGAFHLVWLTDSTQGNIGYATSRDLIHWTGEKELPITSGDPGSSTIHAPELFYQKTSKTFFLIWSTSTKLYYTTTKNFTTFEPINVFYNPGYKVNDPFVFKHNGSYHLFVKNEETQPLEENIRMVSSLNIKKLPILSTEPLTGSEPSQGPSAIKIGKYIYLYYNNYRTGTYRAMRCKNLREGLWEDVTPYMNFPTGKAQGTVFKVNDAILHDLQSFPND